MRYKEEIVPLAQIDETDETYRITTTADIDDLAASIKDIGLIHTPIIEARDGNGPYTILSGFRRIKACKLLQIKHINAKVIDSEHLQLDRAKISVSENSFQRVLNPIETNYLNIKSIASNYEFPKMIQF